MGAGLGNAVQVVADASQIDDYTTADKGFTPDQIRGLEELFGYDTKTKTMKDINAEEEGWGGLLKPQLSLMSA